MASPPSPSALVTTCRICGEPQPTGYWRSDTTETSLQAAWEQAAPIERYCGVCGTPACEDEELDRLQSRTAGGQAARLYGSNLVSPAPEVVAFMAGWDVASKGEADQ